ncbi:hypothetical protein DAPPUDRAFT_246461 [Daphnia pulex]|uniref:Uncharacterized protein n=1 Tax=Daphnia pulex TaxID=6669 RepID=E9GQK5_DAPPU|nr:hypothetical protein DAPPUDRAFT_246461 [Daphnia pulex]|eukprot:EFX78125.1 hypothetical protein DAPPUDRAFT_246461 [Daphnia pulex]
MLTFAVGFLKKAVNFKSENILRLANGNSNNFCDPPNPFHLPDFDTGTYYYCRLLMVLPDFRRIHRKPGNVH